MEFVSLEAFNLILKLEVKDHFLESLTLSSRDLFHEQIDPNSSFDPLVLKTVEEVTEYLEGKRQSFDLPYKLKGTSFQLRVWEQIAKIPYGSTISYGNLAKDLGNPNLARAVGGACNKNPLWLIIPCHRVIGSSGDLVGYEGGLDLKKRLLDLEQS